MKMNLDEYLFFLIYRRMSDGQAKKLVLAYSGGLDTSVAIKWLQQQGYDVVAVGLDVGEGKDVEFIKQKKHYRSAQ
ncbi:hypothetical protein GCM10020331_031860 [Ectobacillus funiculus]